MKKILRYGYFVSITVFGLISLISLVQPVYGQWSIDPTVNTPVSTTTGQQTLPQIVGDGSGGAIITWSDDRNSATTGSDIYAQRVNNLGQLQWAVNGVPVTTAMGNQGPAKAVDDGNGGAIVAWVDTRYSSTTGTHIYVQRINGAGQVQWTANGIPVDTAIGVTSKIQMISDGLGGAIITWKEYNSSSGSGWFIYAQRISGTGQVLWQQKNGIGVPVDTETYRQNYNQFIPYIVSDGFGGAIITWDKPYKGIYAQRINIFGQIQWTTNGEPVDTTAGFDSNPQITSDGSGGAIITWAHNNSSVQSIYAQRINGSGQIQWTSGGFPKSVAVCTNQSGQSYPQILSDENGGAIIAWLDNRNYNGTGFNSLYAQRINAAGQVQWATDGVPVCTAGNVQQDPTSIDPSLQMTGDGSHGAIITWQDTRNVQTTSWDLYSQRISAAGQVQWSAGGIPVSTAKYDQDFAQVTKDGSGGFIVTWSDHRNSSFDVSSSDIYADRIDQFGNYVGNPIVTDVKDVPGDQGGKVTVSWNASPYDVSSHQVVTGYSIWRGIDRQTPSAPLLKNAPSSGASSDFTQSAGGPTYRTRTVNGVQTTWEWLADVPSHDLKHYSYTAATTSDSSGSGTPYFKYFVSAQTANSFEYWDSQADSGYSIDNLAPNAPANVMGSAMAGTVKLHWNPNTESDLGGYDVFRGSAPGFNPDTMSTYATVTDTAYTDTKPSSSGTVYYVVRAVDVHGNQSPSSNEVSVHLTAVQDNKKADLPTTFALKQNYPNPFNPTTVIPYQLAAKSHVTLTIYNVLGQQVATLVNSDMKAGRYHARWDAYDMPSGVYIYLLRAGSFMQSRKLILIK